MTNKLDHSFWLNGLAESLLWVLVVWAVGLAVTWVVVGVGVENLTERRAVSWDWKVVDLSSCGQWMRKCMMKGLGTQTCTRCRRSSSACAHHVQAGVHKTPHTSCRNPHTLRTHGSLSPCQYMGDKGKRDKMCLYSRLRRPRPRQCTVHFMTLHLAW